MSYVCVVQFEQHQQKKTPSNTKPSSYTQKLCFLRRYCLFDKTQLALSKNKKVLPTTSLRTGLSSTTVAFSKHQPPHSQNALLAPKAADNRPQPGRANTT
jgi:hypothetical protein